MKRFLLCVMTMLCAVTGAWATNASINTETKVLSTNDDRDLSGTIDGDWLEWVFNGLTELKVEGTITQTGLDNLMTKIAAITTSYASFSAKLNLSNATISGSVSHLNNNTAHGLFTSVIYPAGTILSGIDFNQYYTYAYSAASEGIVNVYVASGTTSVPELTAEVFTSATRVNVSGDGATEYIATLTSDQQAKCVIPFSGYVEAIGGSVQTIVNTTVVTDNNALLTDVTSLKIVSGTVSDADVTWITGYLTNMTTLDVSNATLTAEQIFTLMGMSSVTTLSLSEAQKALLKTLSDKTFTTAMLDKIGLSVNNLLNGMTTHNFIEGINTLYVTGELTSGDLTTIKSKLDANSSITTLDVSRCTNSSGTTNITDSDLSTYVKVVSLPNNKYITYNGTQASALQNGALTIKIGNDTGEYASVEDALSAYATLLESDNVERVKISGALGATDLSNIYKFGQQPYAIKIVNLSDATLASGAAWSSLGGDFGNAGVLLPNNVTTGTMTYVNVFYPNGNVLHAICNVSSTFNGQLEFFVFETGKSIVGTNATNTAELLALTGVNTVINGTGATATVYGVLTSDALSSLSGLTTTTRIDLSNATYSGTTAADISIPSTLTSLVLPKNTEIDASKRTSLKTTASGLTYIYSPTSNNQTVAEQFVPDRVWVLVAGGLDDAVKTETGVQNAIYVKIASDEYLNAADLNLSGEIKATSDGQHGWQYCDFSESMLNPATVGDIEAGHSYSYRIILPNDVTADQMAGFGANTKVGSLAAVYSYNGTRLDIMEINDEHYSQNALTDSRIVRDGTTMINVVSGTYNGTGYNSFGYNLLTAINNAQSVTSIKSVKVNASNNLPSGNIVFTNTNITSLDVSGISLGYRTLDAAACTSLQTLTVKALQATAITAKGGALTSADLTGAIISQGVDLSGNSSLSTFTTDDDTRIGTTLNLSGSGLTAFDTEATIGGDIYLNGSESLASVDLSHVNLTNSSIIHVDATTNEETGTIISTLTASDAIKVPTGFASSTRIHPYNSSIISEQAYVAPAVVFTSTDMTLHEPEAAANGDKLVYWYAGDDQPQGIATVTMGDSRVLSTLISSKSLGTNRVKVKINGPLTADDVAALKDINATVLDLSDATSGVDGTTIVELLADAFDDEGALNNNTKFLIAPDESPRKNLINATKLAGLTNIWSVVATKPNNTAKDVAGNDLGNGYNFTSYTKVPGTLQAATVHAQASSTGEYTRKPNINNTPTDKLVYLSSVSIFRDLTISGKVNAYDLCAYTTVNKNGHLEWDKDYTEGINDDRVLVGEPTYGPFSSCYNITSIDLEQATFVHETVSDKEVDYVTDMTLSKLGIGILNSNALSKVIIPTDPTVEDIPADFMNASIEIDAICIPYNIKRIRTRAFNTIDYVWTTTGLRDPEGNNTRLDNGAEYTDNESVTTRVYATDWDGTRVVNPNFVYTTEPSGGSYTFSSNIELIETAAFANTNAYVKDVYVLNTVAPECHVDAFNTKMYLGNSGYSPVIKDGIITRDSYINQSYWITMLHYPRQTTTPNIQRYTDPTREYSIATGLRDGKGAILYFPNQSEFIRAYTQGTYGYTWNAWDPTRNNIGAVNNGELSGGTDQGYLLNQQKMSNRNYTNNSVTSEDVKKYYSFYDVTDGGKITDSNDLPSNPELVPYYQVQWNDETSSYTTETTGENLYPEGKDYRGWHQFVLNAYAANTILDEEPYRTYIKDNEWWTICPEFDMTYDDVMLFFGASGNVPLVHKLKYVRREYSADGKNKIYLNFSDNLMVKAEKRTNKTTTISGSTVTNADQHGSLNDENGVMEQNTTAPESTHVVMSAGVPYLIKPYRTKVNDKYVTEFRILTSADYEKLSEGDKNSTNPLYRANDNLYYKIKAAQEQSGSIQRALVKNGTYTVPVFVSGVTDDVKDAYDVEGLEYDNENQKDKEYSIDNVTYNKSTKYHYTFVGTFYNSFLPHYCYFLGWDASANKARFFYHDNVGKGNNIDNKQRWANGTGVIVPTLEADLTGTPLAFNHSVTPAHDKEPAQWILLSTFSDDSFVAQSSGSNNGNSRSYDMVLNAPDVKAVDGGQTGVSELKTETTTENVSVYGIDGQLRGRSLNGLKKGVYVVNGKKYIVK